MAKLFPVFVLILLIVMALNFLACGGGETPRQLLSVTVTPSTATASDFPNGMVQFTATGMFSRAPSPAIVNPTEWQLAPSNTYPTDAVSMTTSGVAQCKSGFAGTVTIQGGGLVCPSNPMMGIPCHPVFGTAQLTCP